MAKESDREPGFIALAMAGVRLVGLRGALHTARYGLWKTRLDRRYLRARPTGPEVRPGTLSDLTVGGGVARFTFGELVLEVEFVTETMACLTWTPGSLPVDSARDPAFTSARAPFEHREVDGRHELVGDQLTVVVAADGSVEVRRDDVVLRRERPPVRVGDQWTATVELAPDDRVHGLGERAAPFDLRPGTYGLWNTEQSGSYGPEADPLYITIPVVVVVAPGRSHVGFWENSHRGSVSVGDQLTATFEGGALRTYVAPSLVDHFRLTGTPGLPPRWALGYHQCRWGYETERDIRGVLAGFREHDLPLSAIHFDIDYMDRYRVFTVDTEDFPDLRGLIDDMNAEGVEAVTIIDPGVAKADDFPLYREGHEAGHFVTLPDGTEVNAVVWPGLVGFPDFTSPDVRAWWAAQYPVLLDQGVGGIWHDMCEPAVFSAGTDPSLPLAARHHLEGQGGDHVEGRNLYGLGMAKAGHEGLSSHRPDRRPWIVTRSGWAGVQRYAWTWTGDVGTSWTMLRRTLATALNLGLSGVPYTGPDIGGFSGDPSPELYTRWFQLSAWLPFFRAHSILTMPSREPWKAAGPHLEAVREAMTCRHRLLPYLYTQAWHATHGELIVRPVWWPAPTDEALLDVDDAFLVGSDVLVAPVFERGATSRQVRLPAGRWFELVGEGVHEGVIDVDVTMDRIPVFVRAGAVLPAEEDGRDRLHLYPGGDGSSHWYRDAGDGYGPSRIDHFEAEADGDRTVIRRTVVDEGYEVDDTELEVVVHGGPSTIEVDGGAPVSTTPDQSVRVGDAAGLVVRRTG